MRTATIPIPAVARGAAAPVNCAYQYLLPCSVTVSRPLTRTSELVALDVLEIVELREVVVPTAAVELALLPESVPSTVLDAAPVAVAVSLPVAVVTPVQAVVVNEQELRRLLTSIRAPISRCR